MARAQSPLGDEFRVPSDSAELQTEQDLNFDGNGNLVIVWEDVKHVGLDSQVNRVMAATFDPAGRRAFEGQVRSQGPSVRPRAVGGVRQSDRVVLASWLIDPGFLLGAFVLYEFSALTGTLRTVPVTGMAEFRGLLWSPIRLTGGGFFGLTPADCYYPNGQGHPCAEGHYLSAEAATSKTFRLFPDFPVESGVSAASLPLDGVAVAGSGAIETCTPWDPGCVYDLDVYLLRLDPNGERLGPPVRVNSFTAGSQDASAIATAADGSLVVVWVSDGQNGELDGIYGQRFDPAGSFAVVYERQSDVYARRFAASAGAEACLVAGSELLCDLGRTGGEPEWRYGFAALAGAPAALAGDVDGDGRDDLCARAGKRFVCDLNHRGVHAELDLSFGRESDTALLGDLDGNGTDDPCVRRGNLLLCDTAHNGGKHEFMMRFGKRSDPALLGDVDGDGRDEICVYRAGVFLCDVGHDGGKAELKLSFGLPGDTALLADFDADGDDDPCVYRGDRFLCDIAHGGAAPSELQVSAKGVPLLANIDGL